MQRRFQESMLSLGPSPRLLHGSPGVGNSLGRAGIAREAVVFKRTFDRSSIKPLPQTATANRPGYHDEVAKTVVLAGDSTLASQASSVAFYGAYCLLKTTHLISWNILHDGIIAAGKWREIILIVLAIVCAVELAIMGKRQKVISNFFELRRDGKVIQRA